MDDVNDARAELAQFDAGFTAKVMNMVGPFIKRYFRSEVRGVASMPEGGALVVSNHSGGMFTPDLLVFASAYYDEFGYDRPIYTLAHNTVYIGPFEDWLPRAGVIHASQDNAAEALRAGGVVLVFPGGDYDSYRPTSAGNVIDFNGRSGYVRTAIRARVPIVPMVSIGAQESQLFLGRGNGLAKKLGLDKRLRMDILPLSVGFPFGLSLLVPPNLPLPTKIVTEVLDPVDVVGTFGEDPDVAEVDAHVRALMQDALDRLARQRRFPIIG
jgi:1-acyl-sn-glycerol-3-phosphate acyltransferase